jgi:Polysaccharide lyase
MKKKVLWNVTLMVIGVMMAACDQQELQEVTADNTAVAVNAASSNVVMEETFEGSDPLAALEGVEFGTAHAFKQVTAPVFAGKKVARIELRDSDPKESGGTRAEMVAIKNGMQAEMWFSFAVYLPAADFAIDSGREIISQWHQVGGTNPPTFLLIQKDKWSFEVAVKKKPHLKYNLGQVAKNTWNQFTFHYIQSKDAKGLVEVWLNGKKVVTHKGATIHNTAKLPKWKVGIYKWDWNGSQRTDVRKRVLYLDNIRVGSSKATLSEMTPGA